MPALPATPQSHDGPCHNRGERLLEAQQLCEANGVRFTPMRRSTYELLLAQKAPLTAYDILAKLEPRLKKSLAPPTVYRALDFLLKEGLIHKLESSNSYLACNHPGLKHESLYLICSQCQHTEEVDDQSLVKLLSSRAEERGFALEKQVVELTGLCAKCA